MNRVKYILLDYRNEAFNHMKAILVVDVLMAYLSHNIPFHINTNAPNYQIDTNIVELKQPVVCLSKELTKPIKITVLWRRNSSSPLSWSLKHSDPCSLVLNSSFIQITKTLPLPTLTVTISSTGNHVWKSMDQLSSITLAKRMSSLIHFTTSMP